MISKKTYLSGWRHWRPALGVLAVGAIAFSLSLQGASAPNLETRTLDEPPDLTATVYEGEVSQNVDKASLSINPGSNVIRNVAAPQQEGKILKTKALPGLERYIGPEGPVIGERQPALAACTITNMQGSWAWGYLAFSTPGGIFKVYFDPGASGGVSDPGCGQGPSVYPFRVDNLQIPGFANAAAFGYAGEEAGDLEYTFDIECTLLPADPCSGPGTQLWESALQFLSIPVGGPTIIPIGIASPGICAPAPFFMGLRYQSWTGASNRVPSPLWDADETDPPCRGWLSNDGGATWTDQEVFFGGDLGWCDYVVTGNTLDACTPEECPIPIEEACCFGGPGYDCQDLSPTDCTTAGGTSQGVGTRCSQFCCPAPPPRNDVCDGPLVLHTVPSGVITGDTQGATADCSLLGDPDPIVWEKFELTECTEVTVSFCNTDPALTSVWIVVFDGCPCDDPGTTMIFSDDQDFDTCPDGNPTVYFTLPAGIYYLPINADQCDIYTVEFTGAPCSLATCCYESPPGTSACQYTDRFTCNTLDGYWHVGSPDLCPGFCDTGLCCVDPSVDPSGCIEGETITQCQAHTPPGNYVGGDSLLCADNVCPPLNDDCADAILVCAGSGSCSTPFTNLGATNDGPDDCADGSGELGSFNYDVWFDYQAVCDGTVTVSTCNADPLLTYDGMMAAYNTTNCPPGAILGCDDDFCGGADMSQFEVAMLTGDWMKIRVGGWDPGGFEESAKGNGVLEILACPVCGNGITEPGEQCDDGGLCTGDDLTPCTSDLDCSVVGGTCTTRPADCITDFCEADCTIPDPACEVCPYCPVGVPCDVTRCHENDKQGHGTDGSVGRTSDLNPGAGFTVADSFYPETASIDQVCWWGIYVDFGGPSDCGPGTGDDFTITYYDDDGGSPSLPLNILGVRNIPAGDLTKLESGIVVASLGDIVQYGYTAPHAAVTVTANECHWIEIVNNTVGSCYWLWSTAGPETGANGDGVCAQDVNLDGYTVDELVDHDLAFCTNSTMAGPDCGIREGACCDDSDGSCQDAVEISLCPPPLRFVDDTLCAALIPPCGSGACCDYTTGLCTVELGTNCVGPTQTHHPGVDCAEVICDLDDCNYDNGLPDVAGNAPASQWASDALFFAEGADDFTLLGTVPPCPECEIQTIIASITHWNHNGGCIAGGNPGFCDDDPDDYTSIRVTIYADDTPTGPAGKPTEIPRVCVDETDCAAGDTCGTVTPGFCDNTFDNDGTHTGTVIHELTVLPADYSHILLGLPEDSQFEVTMDVSGDSVLLNKNTRYWIAVAPEVNFSGFYQSAMMESLSNNGNPAQQIFSALALTPWQVIEVGVDLSFELIGICAGIDCSLDPNWDPWTLPADRWACDDEDCCTHDECVSDLCESTQLATGKYADLDNNGDVNLQDLLCMLDALASVCGGSCLANGSCDNADISPCAGNGDINLQDLLEELDALAGTPSVACP